jgi:hypothetical protein
MVGCSELPQIAVEHILRLARGRSIAGTNRFARVCQQWGDASEEAEPLQLFLNLSHLSEEDLARATYWLFVHGQHVNVLVVHKDQRYNLDWDPSTASALRHLRRLEVTEADVLEQLAPALKQMPQLQHLAVTLRMDHHPYRHPLSCGKVSPPPPGALGRFLVSAENPWGWVPDMQELCPQLTGLALTVGCCGHSMRMDPAVSQLFNSGLQQLTVGDESSTRHGAVLSASALGHLSALQQLTLDGVVLELDGSGGAEEGAKLAQGLAALQQLRMYHPRRALQDDAESMACLGDSLVDYEVFVEDQDVGMLASCVHLTRLVLCEDLPEGTADALAALTGLQELGLRGPVEDSTADVVQQAAGMAQLRCLQLVGYGEYSAELAPGLAQCRQLTSLVLLVGARGQLDGPYQLDDDEPLVSALQQLPGLRCLTVRERLVLFQQGAWLAALTALTCLSVQLDYRVVPRAARWPPTSRQEDREAQQLQQTYHAAAQQLVTQVHEWPVGLQQVVFWTDGEAYGQRFKPMSWQLSAPGRTQVTAWLEQQDKSAPGWARPFRPCPHLPGVWELQGEVDGRPWYLVSPAD